MPGIKELEIEQFQNVHANAKKKKPPNILANFKKVQFATGNSSIQKVVFFLVCLLGEKQCLIQTGKKKKVTHLDIFIDFDWYCMNQ